MFVASYYSWEFTDTDGDTSYTGYYIQFLALRTAFAGGDSSAIVHAIAAAIPFILSFLSVEIVLYRFFLCFDSIMSSFDWAETGFWSIGGLSNVLGGGFLAVCMRFNLIFCFCVCMFWF